MAAAQAGTERTSTPRWRRLTLASNRGELTSAPISLYRGTARALEAAGAGALKTFVGESDGGNTRRSSDLLGRARFWGFLGGRGLGRLGVFEQAA